MKKLNLVVGVLGTLAVALCLQCGGSDSDGGGNGNGSSIDCNALCDKSVTCDSSETKEECLDGCNGAKKMVQQAYMNEAKACIEKCTPGNPDSITTCMDNAESKCTTPSNLTSFADGICTWMIGCYPEIPEAQKPAAIDSCKTSMTTSEEAAMMKCFTNSALDTLKACVTKKDCADVETAIDACMASEFGMNVSG